MSELNKERLLDLLTDQVLFGLNTEEAAELSSLRRLYPEITADNSLELTASAIGLNSLYDLEPMPDNLQRKILADADLYFSNEEKSAKVLRFQPQLREVKTENIAEEIQQTFEFEPKRPFMQWLGWAFAGFASIALAFSLWANMQKPNEVFVYQEPNALTITEQYDKFMASAKDVKRTAFANAKNDKESYGEIIWSEAEQKGFMKLKGLPVNDTSKEAYQVWIFDENQNPKTPIDGGVFDVASSGEVLIPINPKLKFKNPKMFAITAEKPGGVVVSPLSKVMALGKVEA